MRLSWWRVGLIVAPMSAFLQEHPLVGNWTLSVPAGVRGADGGRIVMERRGELSVTAVGDSLIATLKLEPVASIPAQTRRLAGPRTNGTVSLSYSSEASLVGAGGNESRVAVTSYVLTVQGDSLTGVLRLRIPGTEGPGDQAIAGVRRAPVW